MTIVVCSSHLSQFAENDYKNEIGHFSSFSSGFPTILFFLQSDEEIQRQAENDIVEQFRHYFHPLD